MVKPWGVGRENKAHHLRMCASRDRKSAMARKVLYPDVMQARFRRDTFARIEGVLEEDEDRTEFVRRAVDRELKRREAAARKKT